ncbi:helix-turn-helix domain-containing protein [Staphylospora marina]|uniref:helix-turn-helix domain-containing protein n=1 Tax=Staphylospora marina TaxID=2490858 RepID=UPI000F5BFD16|nr:helix-turn-helix transcriptional regulator [Staphylospora marina]
MKINLVALRVARKQRKITLEEMARAIGKETPAAYYFIESGKTRLLAEHIPPIAKALGMSVEELSRLLFSEFDFRKSKFTSDAV